MHLTIRILGLELLHFEASTEEPEAEQEYDGSGTTASTPVTFLPSPGDQRWEQVAEYE